MPSLSILTKLNELKRNVAFVLILCALSVPSIFMIASLHENLAERWGQNDSTEIGERFAILIVRTAPVISQDISLLGEITPFAVAGILATLAPKENENGTIIFGFLAASLGWVLNLWLSVITSDQRFIGQFKAVLDWNQLPDSGVTVLQNFVGMIRIVFLVVAASLIGIKVRGA